MHHVTPRIYWLAVTLWLCGCAHLNHASTPANVPNNAAQLAAQQAHIDSLTQIQTFSIAGRMGIQMEGKGLSGKFDWQHTPLESTLGFYSPLGSKLASVTSSPAGATLTTNEQKTYSADSAETLTEQTLGWRVPVNELQDWVLGRAGDSAVSNAEWDHQGRLLKLNQKDWEIEFLQYVEHQGYSLPNKLSLRNPKLYLKLIIDQWQIQPSTTAP